MGRRKPSPEPDTGGDWFASLFGFRELNYRETQRRLKVRPSRDSKWTMEGVNGKVYQVGHFWTPSLRELEATATKLGGLPGRLRVRNIRADISEELSSPENRHATFQVASQFNCLEFASPAGFPEEGVTQYAFDKTQGPACAVACGPAAVFRNYFTEVEGSVGQRQHLQLNTLHGVSAKLGNEPEGRFFRVSNGYTFATDAGLRALASRLESLDAEAFAGLCQELRVGVHEDVQVTSMYSGACPVLDDEQTVTQVLASACSVSYSGNPRALWEPLARLVLSASYEATLWASLLSAIRHGSEDGSRRVFLTCVGGGAFGNSLAWITDAMRAALSKFKDCALEVFVVTHEGPVDQQLLLLEKEFSGQ